MSMYVLIHFCVLRLVCRIIPMHLLGGPFFQYEVCPWFSLLCHILNMCCTSLEFGLFTLLGCAPLSMSINFCLSYVFLSEVITIHLTYATIVQGVFCFR
jgi:hypothetical protein